ncbi:hypothetical protein FPOAC2_04226 [Fusarium poae]|uniref:hypothetical protein n=1 Tax=Fusarium poae TaxID=36050 RepID=UPI001CE91794|nr:hypothetical protein FPOAC1_004196 [Fusarium poae]KAG8670961.1 hypothetical protein FPOAC1_004196 [Fusarium poae]
MAATSPLSQAWDNQVVDRVKHIIKVLEDDATFSDDEVPGLKSLLSDFASEAEKDEKVSDVEFHRRLLRVFRDSKTDHTYETTLARLTPGERKQIEDFVGKPDRKDLGPSVVLEPTLSCREELLKEQQPDSLAHPRSSHFRWRPRIIGSRGTSDYKAEYDPASSSYGKFDPTLQPRRNLPFQNWGLNISNKPKLTYFPTSTAQIQGIVKFAKKANLSVRCAGYRHSWSPIFGKNDQILISLLDYKTATALPNYESLPWGQSSPTELETIEMAPGQPRKKGHKLVRIGCATTNERLRRWCIEHKAVTIPLNVIMVEITIGGSNAPICHGAGLQNQTLSDLVRKIEYVDANGELRSVLNTEHLKAASGCFGLMGIVTHITMEFPPMSYAQLAPRKMPVIQAVPPPPNLAEKDIPPALLKNWTSLTPAEREKCQVDFEERATNDYYAEWFWFPYSDDAWVNTWKNTLEEEGVVDHFPDKKHIYFSFIQTVAVNILQNAKIIHKLIDVTNMSEAAVTLLSIAAMKALPTKEVKAYLPDALHFQRAIQNVRVRNLEVEIPIVGEKDGLKTKRYFSVVQRAWWDAILTTYANSQSCPMRMPLEMRIMGDSNVIMAPQRGNKFGTCSIEILTLNSAKDIWKPFAQTVLDKWMSLENPLTKQSLKIRPHWAKEWYDYEVDIDGIRKPWIEKLKLDYAGERREFCNILTKIGEDAKTEKDAGWSLADIKARFSNDFFDEFFFN